ncbi:MAG: restriction endonuclease subunit S, partial [Eubacteriales bacterium]|nr:restriction endonuclease subunit S [Eubacteriales bacterium]
MPEKAKVPAIRFKGFTDAWEQRKLGELSSITTGKLDANAAKTDGEYSFFTCGKETLKTDTYSFDGNAILISGNGDLGFTRKYTGKFNAYQRTYVLQNFSTDYEYIEHAIHRYLPSRIRSESFGGAMPYIKMDALSELEICIPSTIEAERISFFLNAIEILITLHQRKLLKLKNVKKAMLEKMFPQNNSNVPEIRFAGFTAAWEQRKLGDVAPLRGGFAFQSNEYCNEGIPIV